MRDSKPRSGHLDSWQSLITMRAITAHAAIAAMSGLLAQTHTLATLPPEQCTTCQLDSMTDSDTDLNAKIEAEWQKTLIVLCH